MDWTQYLKLRPEEYNCLTFIDKICKDQNFIISGLDVMSNHYENYKSSWGSFIEEDSINNFIKLNNATLIDIKEITEFDIILFNIRNIRPQHFGLYIGLNKFIHHRKYFKIDELDSEWRDRIKYIIRWKNI
jgi:hypothetical protein